MPADFTHRTLTNAQCFTHKPTLNRKNDTSTLYTYAKDTTLFCTTRHQPGTTYTQALCSPRCSNQNQQRECEDFEVQADTRCDKATQEDATCLATRFLSTSMSPLNAIIQLSDYVRDANQIQSSADTKFITSDFAKSV